MFIVHFVAHEVVTTTIRLRLDGRSTAIRLLIEGH